MTIQPTEPSLTITLNKDELIYLSSITQNYLLGEIESAKHTAIRMQLFVAASRALGYNMQPDGSIIIRTIRV